MEAVLCLGFDGEQEIAPGPGLVVILDSGHLGYPLIRRGSHTYLSLFLNHNLKKTQEPGCGIQVLYNI
jgi:hypothetical protein